MLILLIKHLNKTNFHDLSQTFGNENKYLKIP